MTGIKRFTESGQHALTTVWHYRLLVAVVFVILMAISFVFVSNIPRQYVAGANLLVVNGNTRDDPTLSSSDLPSIATSTVVLSRMEAAIRINTPLAQVKRHIVVKQPPFKSSILRIEYTDSQPERAMLVANAVAEELTSYYRQTSTARFDDDLTALDAEMTKQRERTRQLGLQVGGKGVNAAISAKGAETIAARFSDLEMNRAMAAATLEGDIANLNGSRKNLQRQTNMVRYEILHGDPMYQSLQTSAATSSVQLANDRAAFTAAHPGLPALEDRVKSLNSALNAEARRALTSSDAFSPSLAAMRTEQQKAQALVEADRAKLAAVNSLLAVDGRRAQAFPSIEVLRLERDGAQAAYLSLAARRATALANRADALSLGSVSIVDRAIVSDSPIGLGRGRLLVMIGLLVVALAIASAFIADQFNPRLARTSQVEDLYGHPVVATLGTK
ncbi:MAG: hypothetical protein JWN27_358 [Candidatus Eremiobacteraeota bacterium]|nr:hypothetical protein [Candidatus Eremiobacteraeota bacterium]